uniref:Uncharacterized protein n=1 Tax=Arundo donax TaxID=35708 RepID=A0A0A9CCN1_ARUDO
MSRKKMKFKMHSQTKYLSCNEGSDNLQFSWQASVFF